MLKICQIVICLSAINIPFIKLLLYEVYIAADVPTYFEYVTTIICINSISKHVSIFLRHFVINITFSVIIITTTTIMLV